MASLYSSYLDLGRLDSLSYSDTVIHRLDPRAKLIVTAAFMVTVVSFQKYDLISLIPFFFFPILMIYLGNLPVWYLLRKLLIVSPFALMIGIFNPLLDRNVMLHLGPVGITGGWISFGSVILRFTLTVGAALILIATTSFPGICHALDRLRVPRLFVLQLMFLYRFIFVLTEEALRMVLARKMRSHDKLRPGPREFIQMVGLLFLRTLGRAERIYMAMKSRGFDGEIRTLKQFEFKLKDLFYVLLFLFMFALLRFTDTTYLIGHLAFRALSS